ncbi:hypothetical protein COW36_17525 [bacterium (Candidatus Blackallbacteria) CG17_big_fil_post_rev_8_21_14_2_50_48_46]|uniref:Peptidase C51 domain-containing protein n=1 Tax=bacterium (Candidatus Blackallbacteria) CG17_big_fil_post_rev_8_21_14_2_50_48_46 TaxID=2014261 RepID=A0A2M7G0K5_9BACT|nr:MAG: hypothetical protein COW64_01205 [bacterium (Candidatus Blackallbacteria) CG18_big_fil_WC_8_21_14_2_50_49_26]PIW15222.1 MAG: hypothetical protein COW36_17525 [bacterium (Candidatus Blackallbacteria) CG17_big_fil_post_rev_8_21_14_2_50_48_46]PIW44809.1 MAG: hypothetical protein COW20_22860 [bacterium (Candidatus Blackallbacteria) CG13_big_fil_rev_8_21_14_2_50_49_14]
MIQLGGFVVYSAADFSRMMDPRLLQQMARRNALPTPLAAPISVAPPRLSLVSDLLRQQDQFQRALPRQTTSVAVLRPLFGTNQAVSGNALLSQKLQQSAQAGLAEWRKGVRETGRNTSPRIDAYARNAKFDPGYEWCGFFTAFAQTQAGFKYPEHYASYQKARDFFMYRSYTNRSASMNQQLDQLRAQQTAQGSTRQYFMLEESPNRQYVREQGKVFSHYNPDAHTFRWQNLPVQAGDVALFHHGHVGLVVNYNPATGQLTTVEGNTSGKGPDGKQWSQAVVMKTYDLTQASDRARFDGFGRPALGDFN